MEDHLIKTFEGLFEYADDTIIIMTPSQKIAYMNKKATNLFQFANQTAFQLVLTEQSRSLWPQFIESLEKNSKGTCVITLELLSNEYLTIRLHSYYVPEHQLIISRVSAPSFVKNEHASPSLNQPIDHMIQHIADGVVVTSLKGQIITANAKALQYLSCELKEIVNRSHDCLFIDMEQEDSHVLLYYRQLANYEHATLKASKMQADGKVHHYYIESRVDLILGIVMTTIIDETEKMVLLNKAEHQNSLFLIGQNCASIMHELRNPLTSLVGFLQLIKEDASQGSISFIQIMENELRRMDNMLEGMLVFSKPQLIQFEHFCLLEVVREVVDLMQVQAIATSTLLEIEFKKMDDYHIVGHRERVKQMIINLVKNSIEATVNQGEILLKLMKQPSGECSLIVSDEGVGMTQQTVENLFDPYYTTKATGTGLGMMFVQKVIREHKADIMLCTDVGYGTQIKINFKQGENTQETYGQSRLDSQPQAPTLHWS